MVRKVIQLEVTNTGYSHSAHPSIYRGEDNEMSHFFHTDISHNKVCREQILKPSKIIRIESRLR